MPVFWQILRILNNILSSREQQEVESVKSFIKYLLSSYFIIIISTQYSAQSHVQHREVKSLFQVRIIFFFFFFYVCTSGIWKFLGQGLTPSCSCDPCCSCDPHDSCRNARSFNLLWGGDQTHTSTETQASAVTLLMQCARAGTLPSIYYQMQFKELGFLPCISL